MCIWGCSGKCTERIYLGNKHFPSAEDLGKVNYGMKTQ